MDNADRQPDESRALSGEQWRRLRDLFGDAQEMPASERKAFLDRALAGEPALRAELDSFLASAETVGAFLAPRDTGGARAAASPPSGSPVLGSMVGSYRLAELLGEGGFGIVYLADQVKPIRRRVALKLIKPGMDTRQVIARFEAERQTLALMDHSGIAQVFEAGETDAGRPFFAMEYVPGVPITAFCDQERLRTRERLELFLDVCDAVQHAHQKGIIHRDLKPSNVLVSRRDGAPALKVIDFGIVKATGASGDERSFVTREGMVLGTIGYMSPEQAGAIQAEIDTRSDIYSLGVLLYELLAGEMPFDRARLQRADWSEAVRIIREEDPPSLTTRLMRGEPTTSSNERNERKAREDRSGRIAEIASRRAADERTLLRELHGELEWITLRALEKEPNRRYASASELSADIRRHLANEPVLARAPSTIYRVRKYARRHRVGVAAAALVLLAIVAGGIAATVGFTRAVRAERAARREAESSRQVSDFLVKLFQASSPDQTKGEVVTARTLLDEGTRRVETSLQEDPLVRARVLDAMSTSYQNLGHYEEAIRLARKSLEAAETAEPRPGLEVARRLYGLAHALYAEEQTDSVVAFLDRAIAILEASDETDTKLLATCFRKKGSWWNERGEGVIADSLLTRALELAEAEAEPDSNTLMQICSTKANIAHRRYDLPTAERFYLRTLELSEKSQTPSWSVHVHRRLANVYRALGDVEKTATHATEGVRIARQIYSADHPNLADALGGQADALALQERYEEAIAVREEALRILRALGKPDRLSYELNSLGLLYRDAGQLDLAITRTEEACEVGRSSLGPIHERTGVSMANLARCYAEARRTELADSTYRAAIEVFEGLGDASMYAASANMDYATFCRDNGLGERAEGFYAKAEAALDSSNAGTRSYLGTCLMEHAYLRSLEDRHEEAESMMRRGFELLIKDVAEDAHELGKAYVTWARARARAGNVDGAIDVLSRAARSRATAKEVAPFAELTALRSRADFPSELRELASAASAN